MYLLLLVITFKALLHTVSWRNNKIKHFTSIIIVLYVFYMHCIEVHNRLIIEQDNINIYFAHVLYQPYNCYINTFSKLKNEFILICHIYGAGHNNIHTYLQIYVHTNIYKFMTSEDGCHPCETNL